MKKTYLMKRFSTSGMCKHNKTTLSYRMGQKLSLCFRFKLCLHSRQYTHLSDVRLLCFVEKILKRIIFQGSVATRFRCGEICHKSSVQVVFAGPNSKLALLESVKSIKIW